MKNTIEIPKMLHEVHGEQASRLDVLIPHGIALLASIYLLMIPPGMGFGLTKSVLLFILTYDLIGGVIANFTVGTSSFYAASASRRYKFIALHILQPTLMWYLFKGESALTIGLSTYIVVSALVVNLVKQTQHQLIVSGVLVVIGLFLLQSYGASATFSLQFLLTTFLLKLPLAWAVRWTELSPKTNPVSTNVH